MHALARYAAALIVCAVLCARGAAAQEAPLPSREELAPANRAPPPQRPAEAGLVPALGAGPCPFAVSDIRLTLQAVEFTGAAPATAERLAQAWEGVRGREVPVAEICAIRDRAAGIMLELGVLARVEIPPQEIKEGRVRLELIEAYVAAVRVQGEAGPALRQVRAYFARLEGRPFRVPDVQRQVLLASDLPGVRLATAVLPSAAGRGAVDLEVRVSRDPADLVAAVQNLGSDAVGPWSGLVRADFHSFTALGERTSLVLSSTADGEEQRVVQVLEEVRLGATGLAARGSLAWGESRPGGALEALELESRSFVALAEAEYPLIRHRRRNLRLSGGLESADQTTEVFGGAQTLTRDRVRVLFTRLEGDARIQFGGRPAFAFGGFELRKGLAAFGASREEDPGLSRAQADPQATVLRGEARVEVTVARRLSVFAAGLAQWAGEPLTAYEELSIGAYTIGRGYDPGAVSADRGAAVALEVRYGPFRLSGVQASLFGFYDGARVETLDAGIGSGRAGVASGGGGARLALTPRVSLDVTYARPFDAPLPGARRPDERILLNLVVRPW